MHVFEFELFFLETRSLGKEKWQCRRNLDLNPPRSKVNIIETKIKYQLPV